MSVSNNSTRTAAAGDNVAANVDEENLRKSLRAAMQHITSREPLDPKYTHLLSTNVVTPHRPVLVKGDFYKRLGSQLRPRVEAFLQETQGKDPFDRIAQRKPLDDTVMRAAFTLRDAKEHEQQALLEATLASIPRRNGMDQETRKRYFDEVALSLKGKKLPSAFRSAPSMPLISAAEQTEQAIHEAAIEQEREMTRRREEARRQREEEDRMIRDGEMQKRQKVVIHSPKHALHEHLIKPVFKPLWDMEFPSLGGSNPFRIVIDRENCASIGAPDYFTVITTPMNLTYVQRKIDGLEYAVLADFFADINLIIKNCLAYNSNHDNPYHKAAQEFNKKFQRLAKSTVKKAKARK